MPESTPIAVTHGHGQAIVLTLDKPTLIDTVILQEETILGERVRAYRLEGRIDGAWKLLGEGSAIGHKRIQPVRPQRMTAIRVLTTNSTAKAQIRTLAVFNTNAAPPRDWNAISDIWASDIWASNLVGKWSGGTFSLDLRTCSRSSEE